MKANHTRDFIESWVCTGGNVNSMEELTDWIENLNKETYVNIQECSINTSDFWFYDKYRGEILNKKRSFFSIIGMRLFEDGSFVGEQPIILQPEIGYLGIICKKIDGVLNFLMQAKIEPGNVNCVQISPTIQATKSNFMRVHGGKLPDYFEYFDNSERFEVLYDQVQSEQASRFYKKRNLNMIMLVSEEIKVLKNYKRMTLGQIKQFMKIDNLVNMDTRTVLSGLPFSAGDIADNYNQELEGAFSDKGLFRSIFMEDCQKDLPDIFQKLNDYKMFKDITTTRIPLNQLAEWHIDEFGITCRKKASFCVRYYNIEICGREVQCWSQPLLKATGIATFGLLTKVYGGVRKYLVQLKPEIGSFDGIELGPSIQWESSTSSLFDNDVDSLFRKYVDNKIGIRLDVLLSEEGGRFYHEQNRNVIVELLQDEQLNLPAGYLWVNYSTLNYLIQMNNCLNIQLRNLLALIDL